MMKKLIVPICILLLSTASFSQTRSRTTKRGTQTSKAPKVSAQPGAEAKTNGAMRVADQIKNLTRFVYLLGGVAKGIEQVDEAARKNEASSAAIDQNNRNKATVIASLQNVREGQDQLDVYFRSTPELEQYDLKL